jgi:hypothetical protein
MKHSMLSFVLGIAVVLMILPSPTGAWGRHGHAAFVVASPGVVVVVPRSPVVVVRHVPPQVVVAAPHAVFVPAPVAFVAVRPVPHCGRWWWDGWRWVWVRAWC